jgi:hypothetical protein
MTILALPSGCASPDSCVPCATAGTRLGLGETEDAIRLLRSDVIKRPQRLKEAFRALFSGRLSDWTKFDDVFDAYWLGRGVKSGIKVSGSSSRKTTKTIREMVDAQGPRQDTIAGDVDRVPGEEDEPSDETPSGRREGASIADHLGKTDFRNILDPEQLAKAHELAEKLARAMRIRLTRRDKQKRKGPRLDLAQDDPSLDCPGRHTDRVDPQGAARASAPSGDPPRCFRVDEQLHRCLHTVRARPASTISGRPRRSCSTPGLSMSHPLFQNGTQRARSTGWA